MRFRVAVPKVDKSEFNLKGQMLSFSLPLTDAVSCFVGSAERCFGAWIFFFQPQHSPVFLFVY